MTESELIDAIVKQTELPRNVVAYILDTEHKIVAKCLARGEEVSTRTVKLHSSTRTTQVIDPKTNERKEHSHVMIYVKPRSWFRKYLNGD